MTPKQIDTSGAVTPNSEEWNRVLKQLVDGGESSIVKHLTDGTAVEFYLSSGQKVVYAVFNNEKASDGFIDGARQGYIQSMTASFDPYKLSPLPEPPPPNSPIEEWIRYYFICKSKGLKIKWSIVAEMSGFTEGQLKTAASRMKNIPCN